MVAPLSEGRVVHVRPFYFSGVDYAGPLLAKSQTELLKIWIVLFVCGTTRAVHLDIVTSLSTEDFLLAFRRFVAKNGQPHQLRSDNARTSRTASEILPVKWIFYPPGCPWRGGFYERLVGVIKSPLKKILG